MPENRPSQQPKDIDSPGLQNVTPRKALRAPEVGGFTADEWPENPKDEPAAQMWSPSSRSTRLPAVAVKTEPADDDSLVRYRQSLIVDAEAYDPNYKPSADIPTLTVDAIVVRFDHPSIPPLVMSGLSDPDNGPVRRALLENTDVYIPEGIPHSVAFIFRVHALIVSRIVWRHCVRKAGVSVYAVSDVVGSYAPRALPYTWSSGWITTPSGTLAKFAMGAGTHTISDADGDCHLALTCRLRLKSPSSFPQNRQFSDQCPDSEARQYIEAVDEFVKDQVSLMYSHQLAGSGNGETE